MTIQVTSIIETSNSITVITNPSGPTVTIQESGYRGPIGAQGPTGPQGPVGNLVFVSKNSEPAITSNLLNFVNTATITVDVIQNGMNAEIAFTAVGGAAFDQANAAYDQANAAFDAANTANVNALTAYDQANAAYTAANNAKVTVYANSDSNVTTQVINFINTASVLVDVIADGSNANVSFLAVGGPAYDQANAAYAQANAAYDAANNARVTVFANNASNVTTQNINFVNTSTVSVTVSPDASNANVQLDLTELQYSTNTTSAEVVDLWSASNYRSGKYHMQVENFLGFFATDLMIIHDGNATNLTLFGETSFGSNTGIFTSDLHSGFVRLLFTPNDSTTNLTFTRKLLQNRSIEVLPTDLMLGINTYDLMNILYFVPTDLNA
jgi:hypothetical protein